VIDTCGTATTIWLSVPDSAKMADPFRSKRLQFTAIDPERDVDVYYDMAQDSTAQMQLNLEVPRVRPQYC